MNRPPGNFPVSGGPFMNGPYSIPFIPNIQKGGTI